MSQYRPAYRAYECATPTMPLDRRVTRGEVAAAVRQARADKGRGYKGHRILSETT